MTVYLITPYEDMTAACASSSEALRLITDHIGMRPVSRREYDRADEALEQHTERTFKSRAAYLRWREEALSGGIPPTF